MAWNKRKGSNSGPMAMITLSAESIYSSDDSDKEALTPVLEARSTVESTRQANAELDISPTEPYKVCTELQEGASLSNQTEAVARSPSTSTAISSQDVG
jgi:hypothetical protein